MADLNRLGDQYGWCLTSKDKLLSLLQEIKLSTENYEYHLQAWRDSGTMDDYITIVESYNHKLRDIVNDLEQRVNSDHIPYLEKQVDAIASVIQALTDLNK